MVKWEKAVNKMSAEKRMELAEQAAALAIRAVRLTAYLDDRRLLGSHESGVKAQNKAARQVRRVLGYTYPDNAVTF